MTLRCECGGPVRVIDGTDPANSTNGFVETYECQTCGRTGTYSVSDQPRRENMSGCLVNEVNIS